MLPSGTVLQFFWRFCTIGSRAFAVALFASQFSYWLFPIAIGHWGVMTIWIMHQGTRFCDTEQGEPRPCFEYALNMILGAIYLVCFLNVKDEPTRFKYLSYYLIVFVENVAFVLLWFFHSQSATTITNLNAILYQLPVLIAVIASFVIGISFMLVYYRFFHPNGRPLWINRAAKCC